MASPTARRCGSKLSPGACVARSRACRPACARSRLLAFSRNGRRPGPSPACAAMPRATLTTTTSCSTCRGASCARSVHSGSVAGPQLRDLNRCRVHRTTCLARWRCPPHPQRHRARRRLQRRTTHALLRSHRSDFPQSECRGPSAARCSVPLFSARAACLVEWQPVSGPPTRALRARPRVPDGVSHTPCPTNRVPERLC